MRIPKIHVALCLFVLCLSQALQRANAQTLAAFEQGIKPYGSYDGGDIDAISMVNGNLSLHIPLISYPQRGGKLHLGFSVEYIAPVMTAQGTKICGRYSCTYTNVQYSTAYSGGFNSIYPGISIINDFVPTINPTTRDLGSPCNETGPESGGTNGLADCPPEDTILFIGYSLHESDGATHEFSETTSANHWISSDASGYTIDDSAYVLRSPDGLIYNMGAGAQLYSGGGPVGPVRCCGGLNSIEDANGNKITPNNYVNLSGGVEYDSITDTLGRIVPMPFSYSSAATSDFSNCSGPLTTTNAYLWSPPGPNGGTLQFKICFAQVPYTFHPPRCTPADNCSPTNSAITAIQSIVLPNETAWTFTYSSTGLLHQITMPTGGTISYTWADGGQCNSTYLLYAGLFPPVKFGVASRTINANDGTGDHTTYYQLSTDPEAPIMTVTDAFNNDTVHTITDLGTVCTNLYETESDRYQGTGASRTLLKKTVTAYQSVPNPNPLFVGSVMNIVPTSVTTTDVLSGQVTKTTKVYDSGFSTTQGTNAIVGNVLNESVYDYGSGSPGNLLRQTNTQYMVLSGPNKTNYFASNLFDLPYTVQVADGSGIQASLTQYNYDEATPNSSGLTASASFDAAPPTGTFHGNNTSTQRWLNAATLPCFNGNNSSGTVTASQTFFDTGLIHIATDSCGNQTTNTYGATYAYAWPTEIDQPLGISETYTYDLNTGQKLSATDANGQTTTYQYIDPLGRVTDAYYPEVYEGTQGHTHVTYNDAGPTPSYSFTTTLDSSHNETTSITADGFGRTIQSQLADGTISYTSYDALGRVGTVSTPYSSAYPLHDTTTYGYDALSRKFSETRASDNSQLQWAYTGNMVDSYDESGRHTQHISDALGRLTRVIEQDGSTNLSSAPVMTTAYTYDALNNLKSVNQAGLSGTDMPLGRSFTYDSLSRLTTSFNPEAGSTTYTYDPNGNLASKTDSNSVTMAYTYDALNRLTLETGQDPSHIYAPISNSYSYGVGAPTEAPNSIGRLIYTSNGIDSSRQFQYDTMGRPANSQDATPNYPITTSNQVSAVYDLMGNPRQITYPDGRIVAQNFDSAGRMYAVADATSGTPVPYLNINAFYAGGHMRTETLGNNDTIDEELNARLQLGEIYANNLANPVIAGALGNLYDRVVNYVSPNDGNISSITDNINASLTQSFGYDNLNHIHTASRADGAYNHVYNIDSFGNMLRHDLVNGDLNYSIDHTTNRLQLNTADLQYDAAGELVSDPLHQYSYTAAGMIAAVDAGQAASYSYYADGQRSAKFTPAGNTDYIYFNGQPLAEHDGLGTWTDYIYASGQKLAKLAGTASPTYFVDDHLGTLNMELAADGSVLWQGDNTPFGQDIISGGTTNALGYHDNGAISHYKFTGKERDTETGFDYFGARYYGSNMGRWLSPDWSAKEDPVPYAKMDDPQTLNLYGYVGNNPLSRADADGHVAGADDVVIISAAAVAIVAIAAVDYFNQPSTQRSLAAAGSAAVGTISSTLHSIFSKADKKPPNPYGSKGAPDHQATVDEEAAKMGANGQREVRIPTPSGAKGTRVADAAKVENGKVTAVTQVIRPKKNGQPPKREIQAARDIENATGVKPRLVPVRPLPNQ